MGGAKTKANRGTARTASSTGRTAVQTVPLPWPPATLSRRAARCPHAHHCTICRDKYRCSGPDETGSCTPVCAPCYWVELGSQLRIYQALVDSLSRKRRKIQARLGTAVCRRASAYRRKQTRAAATLVMGFGKVVLPRNGAAHRDTARFEPAMEVHADT